MYSCALRTRSRNPVALTCVCVLNVCNFVYFSDSMPCPLCREPALSCKAIRTNELIVDELFVRLLSSARETKSQVEQLFQETLSNEIDEFTFLPDGMSLFRDNYLSCKRRCLRAIASMFAMYNRNALNRQSVMLCSSPEALCFAVQSMSPNKHGDFVSPLSPINQCPRTRKHKRGLWFSWKPSASFDMNLLVLDRI